MRTDEPLTYQPLLERDGVQVSKSPWGADDEIGRINWITPETTAAIISLLDGRHVFDLSVKTPHMYGRLLSTGRHGLLLIDLDNSAAWNGSSWGDVMVLPPAFKAPALRFRAGWTASYHEPTQQLVLYGGRDSPGGPDLLGSTIVWDGTTWKVLVPASSPSLMCSMR